MPNNILLVDDDLDDRTFFCTAINKIVDANCIALENGQLMMSKIISGEIERPDIIFLDLNMPDLDGWDCLSELKSHEKLKDIPVCIYSTSRRQEDIVKAKSLGALNFFTKPCDYSLLKRGLSTIVGYLLIDNLDELAEDCDLFCEK